MKKINETEYVTFKQAFKDFWTGYFQFVGKTRRSGYWWTILTNILISYGATRLAILIARLGFIETGIMLCLVIYIAVFVVMVIPNLAMLSRRIQDVGYSKVAAIATTVSYVVLIVLGFLSNVFIILTGIMSIYLFVLTLIPSKSDRILSKEKEKI